MRRRGAAAFVASFAAVLAAEVPARAQEGALAIDAGVSWSLPPAASVAESTPYLNLGVRLEVPLGTAGWGFLGGSGGLAVQDSGASWVSVLGGIGTGIGLGGPAFLDLTASGEAFSVGDPWPYRGVVGEGEAALRLELGRATARFAGWGGIGGSETEVIETFTRTTRRGTYTYERGSVVAADLWSWGGRLELAWAAGRWRPWAGLEAYDAPQGTYYGARAGLGFGSAGVTWDLEGGVWDTPTGAEAFVTARLAVPFGPRLAARANGGRYGPDPLLDLEPAAGAGAGISWTAARIGPTGNAAPSAPVSAASGGTRFSVVAPDATTVTLAGDFTEWEEMPLRREGAAWTTTLRLEPGVYRYAYRVDGTWHVPEGTPGRTRDEWDNPVATLAVPGP